MSIDNIIKKTEVTQAAHDNLNANTNLQVGNVDVANGNPVPVSDAGGSLTVDGAVAISSLPNEGQQTMANSISIAVASDQSAVPVSDNGGSLTVDGSVTANAGTNLNTSALALEAGGNLAAAAASLSIIDDWDESDRAKVNPIVGQAGVAGGSGVIGATTQRVVLASNHPEIATTITDTIELPVYQHYTWEVHQTTTISASTSEETILTAPGSSLYNHLTFLSLSNTSQSSVRVDIRDDTGGSVIFSIGLAPKQTCIMPFHLPFQQTDTDNNWTAQLSAAVTDVRIMVQALTNSI